MTAKTKSCTQQRRRERLAPPATRERQRRRWLQLTLRRICRTVRGARTASKDAAITSRTSTSGLTPSRSRRCASINYAFVRRDGEEEVITLLVMRDRGSRALRVWVVPEKGASSEDTVLKAH